MNIITNAKMFLTVLALAFVGNSHASIVLSNIDNDLLMVIENSITFDVTVATATDRLGFTLPGAIEVAGTGGFQLTTDPTTAPLLIGDSFTSNAPGVGLIRGGPDFEVLYFLNDTLNLSVGDQITLAAGEILFPNFFDFSVIVDLNYTIAVDAFLSGTSGIQLSEFTATAVPLPGALLLLISALFPLSIRSLKLKGD